MAHRRRRYAIRRAVLWRGLSAHRVDLLVGRKPAGLLLRESESAIDGNLEHTTYSGHQLDIGAVFLDEPIPRTEGTRFVVSRLAPLDTDFHRSDLRIACRTPRYSTEPRRLNCRAAEILPIADHCGVAFDGACPVPNPIGFRGSQPCRRMIA